MENNCCTTTYDEPTNITEFIILWLNLASSMPKNMAGIIVYQISQVLYNKYQSAKQDQNVLCHINPDLKSIMITTIVLKCSYYY